MATQQSDTAATLTKATDAFTMMTEEQVRETEAYTLGVQAIIWGMQWVKAAEALRLFTAPLPAGQSRSPYDPTAHGVNVWGHAEELLNADTRIIETPNTETLYSMACVDLR